MEKITFSLDPSPFIKLSEGSNLLKVKEIKNFVWYTIHIAKKK